MRSLIIVLSALCLYACSIQQQSYTQWKPAGKNITPQYADLLFWAAHPHKQDPADRVPAPLRSEPRDTIADVFFIHPTTFTENGGSGNADLGDEALNQKTDGSTILFQATAFNQHARVFAPRYRQAHLSSFFIDTAIAAPLFDTAYNDVKTAFEVYLQQYHNGRPIVIAAHSQGARMAIGLLQEFFDGKPLQQYLVAAYVIGWPVLQNQFVQLPVCSSASQTGCFVSWRTFRAGYVPDYIQKEKPASYVVNPLNWRTDERLAPVSMHKGSVLRNFNKIIRRTCNAHVAGSVLWVSKPRFPGAFLINTPNYHIGDINLFYINIRENVADRIKAFINK